MSCFVKSKNKAITVRTVKQSVLAAQQAEDITLLLTCDNTDYTEPIKFNTRFGFLLCCAILFS